jgi:ribosomal protein S18 acetylase RimI-like enzyme
MNTRRAAPEFVLPAVLLSAGYRLRAEAESDTPFLMQLYASTREEELRPVPWDAAQKQAFLANQFAAQRYHYRHSITGCVFLVLEKDGVSIGRLYLEPRPSGLHIVDISLMPAWRGKGLGTALLTALIDSVGAEGRGLGLMVERSNPALRLYRRLGFGEVADHGVYLEMEWRPDPARNR